MSIGMPVNLGVHSVAFHGYLVVTYFECGNDKAVARIGLFGCQGVDG